MNEAILRLCLKSAAAGLKDWARPAATQETAAASTVAGRKEPAAGMSTKTEYINASMK